MAQSIRTRRIRVPKKDQEIHVFSNPVNDYSPTESSSSHPPLQQRESVPVHDYQAPLTSHTLQINSHWLIVRRNLHRIRHMGFNAPGQERLPDFYLGLQMIRELKRAQEEIKNIDKEANFHAPKKFALSGQQGRMRMFDTSHVKPDDTLIYDRLGEEPLALQNLLYYFSKQNVLVGTVFWNFLNGVNQVINLRRKRTVLVQRLRRLALTVAVIIYSFIGIMLFLMIISVISSATKMNDPEVLWVNQNIDGYSRNIEALR